MDEKQDSSVIGIDYEFGIGVSIDQTIDMKIKQKRPKDTALGNTCPNRRNFSRFVVNEHILASGLQVRLK